MDDLWNSGGWQRCMVPLDPTPGSGIGIILESELNPGFNQRFPNPGFFIPANFEDGEGGKELE